MKVYVLEGQCNSESKYMITLFNFKAAPLFFPTGFIEISVQILTVVSPATDYIVTICSIFYPVLIITLWLKPINIIQQYSSDSFGIIFIINIL